MQIRFDRESLYYGRWGGLSSGGALSRKTRFTAMMHDFMEEDFFEEVFDCDNYVVGESGDELTSLELVDGNYFILKKIY